MISYLLSILKKIIPFGLWVLFPLLVAGCSSPKSRPAKDVQPPVYVQVESIEPSTEPIPVYVTGKLTSASEFDLSFKTAGFIEEILVDEGDEVQEGDLLARLNQAETDAQVVRTQNIYEKNQRDLDRIQNLYKDNAATLEQVEDIKTASEIARAERDIALYNQQRSSITAPTNSRVLFKFAEVNEQVQAGEPVFRLGRNGSQSSIIKAGVADRDITRIQVGDSTRIHFDAYPEQPFSGYVSHVSATANQRTGIFDIEITLDETQTELRNGFIARAVIYPSDQKPYIPVPIDALVEAENEFVYVYVPDEKIQSAIRIQVKPVHISNSYFTVAVEDLLHHKNVVTRGAAYLRPGSPITQAGEVN